MGVSASTILVRIGADGKVSDAVPGPDLPKGGDAPHVRRAGRLRLRPRRTRLGQQEHDDERARAHRCRRQPRSLRSADRAQARSQPSCVVHPRKAASTSLGGLTGDPTGYVHRPQRRDHGATSATTARSAHGAPPASSRRRSASARRSSTRTPSTSSAASKADTFTDKVRRATFNDDGTLSAFATMPEHAPRRSRPRPRDPDVEDVLLLGRRPGRQRHLARHRRRRRLQVSATHSPRRSRTRRGAARSTRRLPSGAAGCPDASRCP